MHAISAYQMTRRSLPQQQIQALGRSLNASQIPNA
jgi:hypothetical protein